MKKLWLHKKKFLGGATVLLMLLVLGSCGYITLPASRGKAPIALDQKLATLVAYQAAPIHNSREEIDRTDEYTLWRVRFPSVQNVVELDHEIVTDYYQVRSDKKTPALLALLPLDEPTDVVEYFARHFASHGFSTIIVHREEEYQEIDNIESLNPIFRQTVLDHRQVLDWISQQPELDANRIGAFGISMGGIKAVLVAGSDPRIKATVVALAGGDMANIFVTSAEEVIKERVNELLIENDMTREELEEAIRDELELDPLVFAPALNPETTLQIIALFDKTVPTRNQFMLRQALGRPNTMLLPTGHFGALLYVPEIRLTAAWFFENHL